MEHILKCRTQTTKCQKKTQKKSHLESGKDFLDRKQKPQTIKEKNDKLKTLALWKAVNKIFAKYIFDKGLYSEYMKNSEYSAHKTKKIKIGRKIEDTLPTIFRWQINTKDAQQP